MRERWFVIFLSGAVACACLAEGMGARWWQALILILVLAVCLLISPVRKLGWLPSAALTVYLIGASAALLTGGRAVWLVYGACAALVGWDIAIFSRSLAGDDNDGLVRRCTGEHYKALGLALGVGLAVVTAGLFVRLYLPFLVMLIALLGASTGLLLAWSRLHNKNTP